MFSRDLSIYSKPGLTSREQLVYLLSKKDELETEIVELKGLFNQIIDLAKQLGFQVFDEQEHRYDFYYSLELSRAEVYNYFQRISSESSLKNVLSK
jgi:uncharacterized protein YjfI (DUF2170 family)